jgi:hypothetical protein
MAVYALIGISNADKIGPKLAAVYPNDHYKLTPNVWFVAESGLPKDVGAKLDLVGNAEGIQAVVFPTASYFGYGPSGPQDRVSGSAGQRLHQIHCREASAARLRWPCRLGRPRRRRPRPGPGRLLMLAARPSRAG